MKSGSSASATSSDRLIRQPENRGLVPFRLKSKIMPPVKLFIATTLDGFIARPDGSLDWLTEFPNPDQLDYGYGDFISTIDTVVMGRKTYEEVLGFGVEWPYADCAAYVLTSRMDYLPQTENTWPLNRLDRKVIEGLRKQSKKGIWVIGGGEVISAFLEEGQIDEMLLSIIPVILGKGIRLFPNEPRETALTLHKVESFSTGVVNLAYRRRQDPSSSGAK